jgi:hypothetical protein
MIPYGLEIISELHTTITSNAAIPTFFSDTTLLHRRGNSILYTEKRRQSHVLSKLLINDFRIADISIRITYFRLDKALHVYVLYT